MMPKAEEWGLDLKKLRVNARRMIENTIWYQENKEALRERFVGKYIAILGKEVVGFDEDLDHLRESLGEKGLDLDSILIEFMNPKDMLMIF